MRGRDLVGSFFTLSAIGVDVSVLNHEARRRTPLTVRTQPWIFNELVKIFVSKAKVLQTHSRTLIPTASCFRVVYPT